MSIYTKPFLKLLLRLWSCHSDEPQMGGWSERQLSSCRKLVKTWLVQTMCVLHPTSIDGKFENGHSFKFFEIIKIGIHFHV